MLKLILTNPKMSLFTFYEVEMAFWPMRKKHVSTFNSKRLSLRISDGKCSAFFFVFLCSVVNSFVTKR